MSTSGVPGDPPGPCHEASPDWAPLDDQPCFSAFSGPGAEVACQSLGGQPQNLDCDFVSMSTDPSRLVLRGSVMPFPYSLLPLICQVGPVCGEPGLAAPTLCLVPELSAMEPGVDLEAFRFLPAGRGAQIPSVLEQSCLSRSSGGQAGGTRVQEAPSPRGAPWQAGGAWQMPSQPPGSPPHATSAHWHGPPASSCL